MIRATVVTRFKALVMDNLSNNPASPPVIFNTDDEEAMEVSSGSGESYWWDKSGDESPGSSAIEDSSSDEDEEDIDYVDVHNLSQSSIGSDEPLSQLWTRNAPGTDKFVWKDTENVPRVVGFAGTPGVVDPDLSSGSSPLECFQAFMTKDIRSHVVKETNR